MTPQSIWGRAIRHPREGTLSLMLYLVAHPTAQVDEAASALGLPPRTARLRLLELRRAGLATTFPVHTFPPAKTYVASQRLRGVKRELELLADILSSLDLETEHCRLQSIRRPGYAEGSHPTQANLEVAELRAPITPTAAGPRRGASPR